MIRILFTLWAVALSVGLIRLALIDLPSLIVIVVAIQFGVALTRYETKRLERSHGE